MPWASLLCGKDAALGAGTCGTCGAGEVRRGRARRRRRLPVFQRPRERVDDQSGYDE